MQDPKIKLYIKYKTLKDNKIKHASKGIISSTIFFIIIKNINTIRLLRIIFKEKTLNLNMGLF